MSNEIALIVITAIWLWSGRGLNLCLLIMLYYALFLAVDPTAINGLFDSAIDTTMATYAIQISVDSLIFTAVIYLSTVYKELVRIYLAYGAIIATSLVLNGIMLYDQMLALSIAYELHAIRQEFSIPLDVLFAVLGSAAGGKAYIDSRLRTPDSAGYNRSNCNS